jgi:hypothetical protein
MGAEKLGQLVGGLRNVLGLEVDVDVGCPIGLEQFVGFESPSRMAYR